MNIYEILKEEIISNLSSLYKDIDFSNVKNLIVETPKNPEFGELSSNAPMILAKLLKNSPINIAKQLETKLSCIDYIDKISIEGSGFINFFLKKEIWYEALTSITELENNYGKNNIGENIKINVEFVSANPTGVLHIGHTRSAIYGDALSNLLRFSGYDVTKEFYVNDAGGQIKTLVDSAYVRYREFAENKTINIEEGLYPGEYLIPTGKHLYEKFGDKLLSLDKLELYNLISDIAINDMLNLIKEDLKDLNICHDIFFSEKTLHDSKAIDKSIESLKLMGLIYEGELEAPKGKIPEDWMTRKQLLFR